MVRAGESGSGVGEAELVVVVAMEEEEEEQEKNAQRSNLFCTIYKLQSTQQSLRAAAASTASAN